MEIQVDASRSSWWKPADEPLIPSNTIVRIGG